MKDKRPRSALSQNEIDIREIECWLERIEQRRDVVNDSAREAFNRLAKWADSNYAVDQ